jgi:hypothetical protein
MSIVNLFSITLRGWLLTRGDDANVSLLALCSVGRDKLRAFTHSASVEWIEPKWRHRIGKLAYNQARTRADIECSILNKYKLEPRLSKECCFCFVDALFIQTAPWIGCESHAKHKIFTIINGESAACIWLVRAFLGRIVPQHLADSVLKDGRTSPLISGRIFDRPIWATGNPNRARHRARYVDTIHGVPMLL